MSWTAEIFRLLDLPQELQDLVYAAMPTKTLTQKDCDTYNLFSLHFCAHAPLLEPQLVSRKFRDGYTGAVYAKMTLYISTGIPAPQAAQPCGLGLLRIVSHDLARWHSHSVRLPSAVLSKVRSASLRIWMRQVKTPTSKFAYSGTESEYITSHFWNCIRIMLNALPALHKLTVRAYYPSTLDVERDLSGNDPFLRRIVAMRPPGPSVGRFETGVVVEMQRVERAESGPGWIEIWRDFKSTVPVLRWRVKLTNEEGAYLGLSWDPFGDEPV